MTSNSTAQKSKNQKNCITTGSAGANKDGPTCKTSDENPSSRPSKNPEEGIVGKSASSEGSELLKFGSMLAASITVLALPMLTCEKKNMFCRPIKIKSFSKSNFKLYPPTLERFGATPQTLERKQSQSATRAGILCLEF